VIKLKVTQAGLETARILADTATPHLIRFQG